MKARGITRPRPDEDPMAVPPDRGGADLPTIGCLDSLPRVRLVQGVTPLDRLANIEVDIGGPRLLAKRDDAHPLAFGGNKVRQLEFYFGAAREAGADTVLITGAVQSNFCRLCAAFEQREVKLDPDRV